MWECRISSVAVRALFVYMCICPYKFIYMYVYVYIHTHTHTHTHIYIYIYIYYISISIYLSIQRERERERERERIDINGMCLSITTSLHCMIFLIALLLWSHTVYVMFYYRWQRKAPIVILCFSWISCRPICFWGESDPYWVFPYKHNK